MGFFNRFIAGEFGYTELSQYIRDFNSVVESDSTVSVITGITNSLPMHYIMIVAMLVIAFWGKKLLPLINFLTVFTIGCGVGIYYIHEPLSAVIPLPSIVSGLLIGILAAIIYRLVYIILFIGITFYGTFTIGYAVLGTALSGLGDLRGYIFMGIAAVVVIVALIFRRYAEMLGTAVLGGAVIARLVSKHIYDFTALSLFGGKTWLAILLVTAIIAIPGFIVQFKTRRRY